MGNPIFVEKNTPEGLEYPTGSMRTTRRHGDANNHPIQTLMERQPVDTDELEEMIIRQLQPRSFSLLFGQERQEEDSMETAMGRLRRQLRQSTARLAEQVTLTHRNSSIEARDRLEMDRMFRRVRQERRNENMLFQSAIYRWNMRDRQESDIDISRNEALERLYERQRQRGVDPRFEIP
ncbi:hypothetical protein HDV04_003482 [Boothiomyces sp. JEL0838]|nr:hypothetical protein HDV04_003482 [Boothiomyces sp. JEL0838]